MKNNIAIIILLFLGVVSCKKTDAEAPKEAETEKTTTAVVTFTDAQIKAVVDWAKRVRLNYSLEPKPE